jgi:hypothetical protein
MRIMTKGATSQSIYFTVLDSSSTTGGRLTGLVYNAASLTAYYTRAGAAATAITLATLASASAAWSSGGLILVSDANAPGLIRLDIPDAAIASGVDSVVITLKGATNMAQVDIEIQLVAANLQDAVRAGLTALPNAAAGANGGLPLGNASGAVTLANATHTGAVIPTVTTLTNAPSDSSGVTTLLGKFTGITLLAHWLGAIMGKQAADATAQTEIRASGAGSGTYDPASDSLEALRDNVADVVLDEVVLGSYTMRQLLRGISAATMGKLSGAATTTITIRDLGDSKDVVVATVDADGNRSAITLDLT